MSEVLLAADKLKRLLALALDSSSADGEAMNAIRAARKIVADLGGFEAALAATKDVYRREQQGSSYRTNAYANWDFSYGNPFNSQGRRSGFAYENPFDDLVKEAARKRDQEEAAKRQRERAEQASKDAEQEAKERRDWQLKQAMGQGVPLYEALRRRRLWKPDEAVDDGLNLFSEEMAEFAKTLNKAG